VAFALALLGAAALALRRRWIPLLLLLSPLPFAYALNIAGRLPFGEVRQSAYCFPFFFGLVGAFIERVLGVVRAAPRLRTLALALVSLLGAGYAAASLVAVVRGPQTVDGLILGMTTLTGFETSTRTEDLDAVARLLEEEATRDDLILVSYQSLVTLSIHLGLGPGTPRVDRPARYTYKGRAIHYSPKTGNSFTAGRFLDALADVEARHPGVPARRVIVPLTGWELYSPSLGERIPNVYRPDGAGFSWLRDVRNARGQPIATILDGDRARALERLPDPEELRRFISYLRRRVAGVP
jgi:hypothetical protein